MAEIGGENLLSRLTWRGLTVEDGYITSPGVYAGSDGYIYYTGGDLSGAQWNTDLSEALSMCWHLDMAVDSKPVMILGGLRQYAGCVRSSLGVAWPRRRGILPYFRLYTPYSYGEVGIIGRSWRVSISSNSPAVWSASLAVINISVAPIRF